MTDVRSDSLPAIFGAESSFHFFFEDEALDAVAMRRRFGPHDEDIRNRRVGDPHLGAGQPVAAVDLFGSGSHAARVRAGIGLRQAEAADPFAARQFRKIFLALLVAAVGVDRMHDERGLYAHHRAIAGIDALDLTRDQSISHVIGFGTAILDRQRRSEETKLAHLAEDARVRYFLRIGFDDVRLQPLLRERSCGVADQLFVAGQLIIK